MNKVRSLGKKALGARAKMDPGTAPKWEKHIFLGRVSFKVGLVTSLFEESVGPPLLLYLL
jgi:hypothetical protein